jgi:uncharacterized membrane protein YvbJ
LITCNNCRNKLADKSLFCNMCGIKIKNTCKNCGNELPDGSLFCNMCGNKKSNYEEKTTQTILTNSQNKNNIFLLVFGLMLLVVVISSIVFTVSENKSMYTSQGFHLLRIYPMVTYLLKIGMPISFDGKSKVIRLMDN